MLLTYAWLHALRGVIVTWYSRRHLPHLQETIEKTDANGKILPEMVSAVILHLVTRAVSTQPARCMVICGLTGTVCCSVADTTKTPDDTIVY
jgi:hypothetical protein